MQRLELKMKLTSGTGNTGFVASSRTTVALPSCRVPTRPFPCRTANFPDSAGSHARTASKAYQRSTDANRPNVGDPANGRVLSDELIRCKPSECLSLKRRGRSRLFAGRPRYDSLAPSDNSGFQVEYPNLQGLLPSAFPLDVRTVLAVGLCRTSAKEVGLQRAKACDSKSRK